MRRRYGVVPVLVAVALALGGCSSTTDEEQEQAGTIALLLPEAQTARYETSDRPTFEDVARQRCPDCQLLYANADQNAAAQQEQADAMIARGTDVLVLDAVDTTAATSIVAAAQRNDVAVIAYDRFIDDPDVDYYVSFDSRLIGYEQGKAILGALDQEATDATSAPPGILLVHGSPTDPNAGALKMGVHQAFEDANVDILAEYDTPDWSPTRAQEWVTAQLTQYAGKVDAVYAANDGIAGGAIAAMKAAGIEPIPPVTGQDAELSAVQRIIDGDQLMTVAKATDQQARTAAEVAVRVLRGEEPVASTTIGGIESFLLAPTSIWADDVERVVIQGRIHSVEEICTAPYADACARLGLIDEGAP